MAGQHKMYGAFKKAYLNDPANWDAPPGKTGLTVEIDTVDVTDKLDFNAAYPMPNATIKVQVAEGEVIEAVVTAMSQEMSFNDAMSTRIEWRSLDGVYNGSATVPYPNPKDKSTPILWADSFFKHYSPQPAEFGHSWYGQSKTYVQTPDVPPVDLSQIEADLAKLPAPELKPHEHYNLKGASPLDVMKANLLSPMEFAEKYGPGSGGADMGPITGEDIHKAMDMMSKTTGKTFANTETTFKALEEQMTKFGEVFLESAGGEVIPIGTGEFKLAHDFTPIGKLHEYKATDVGLEAMFTTELVGKPKGLGKNKKQQEANDSVAMTQAMSHAVQTLFNKLSPGGPKQTMGADHVFHLPDGSYYRLKMTLEPYSPKKEDKP